MNYESSCKTVSEFARTLKGYGIMIGERKLFQLLLNEKYLCRNNNYNNLPTLMAIETGLFAVRKSIIKLPYGTLERLTPVLTPIGCVFFREKFINSQLKQLSDGKKE